ncbi:MAG: hypothetical protein H7336_15270 [Bacteriovorax sp.]|nr:hypothetical protein [Bacteriovorax sp.]
MKLFTLTMTLLLSVSLHAETTTTTTTTTVVETTKNDDKPVKKDDGKVIQAAKNVSGETKKVLRKIGRASMDGACELKSSKAECAKQKAKHGALNKKEEIEGVNGN